SVIQLAKSVSAVVIATAGSEQNREYCRQLGADLVLDYRSAEIDDALQQFSEPHGGINVWFETQRQPTLDRSVTYMARRGRIVLMAGRDARPEFPVGPFYVKDLRMMGFAMFNASPDEQRTAADAINRLAADGQWNPKIGAMLPLSEVAAAHQLQEDNTLGQQGTLAGKIVLEV
ncbi:MAG: zinc-binding dehydrogenase, partial [Planctomycetaceae bacterium]